MKKLVILLTSLSISTLSTISMIACGCTYSKNNQLEEETKLEDSNESISSIQDNNEKIDISKITIINPPEKILAENPVCVSKDEWWLPTKIKMYEAIHSINQSLTKDDIKIPYGGHIFDYEKDFKPCYLNKNIPAGKDYINLTEPRTLNLQLEGKNRATGKTKEITILLPKATKKD